jgi:hypothetical protein
MRKHVEELISSILEEYARCEKDQHDLEAKSIFRILNFCPPPEPGIPLFEKPATLK